MSTISGINYQSALTILTQSSQNTETGPSTSAAGLVKAAEQAGTSNNSGASTATPTDTVTLSDQAKSALAAGASQNSTGVAAFAPGGSSFLQSFQQLVSSVANSTNQDFLTPQQAVAAEGDTGENLAIQQFQQQAASVGGTTTVQNANDVPGLDLQENVQFTDLPQGGGGESVSVNFNSQVLQELGQANPNSRIFFDSNPADTKLVTVQAPSS